MSKQLTPNFKLSELLISETAEQLGIDNTPNEAELGRLKVTAYGMEAVRAALYDYPITITSGFRSDALNEAVGGAPTSAHRLGYAVDFYIAEESWSAYEIAKCLLASTLPFDQLILETSRNVVHISFDPRLRRQAMTQRGGAGTTIETGINT